MKKRRTWWFALDWGGEYSTPLEDGPRKINDWDTHCAVIEFDPETEVVITRAKLRNLIEKCYEFRIDIKGASDALYAVEEELDATK